MPFEVEHTGLFEFLKIRNIGLYAKLVELRSAIEDWLSYIPHTFPHYTRHTVKHSDGIVLQVSRLLFRDNEPTRPVVALSATEAYIIGAAAYLHDAGMVTSDEEKASILKSDEWARWTAPGNPGALRWAEIRAFRSASSPSDRALRDFLADVQTRFLIAELSRRTHHMRAREFMTQNQQWLGLFAFNNNILLRTIAAVCIAHGFEQRELEDRDRYPDRRDIEGDEVNVRFAALLLRLGDLLEMSHDRACPLLMNAASPLPAESYAHWTQYQRITHSLVAPDLIELRAECANQEEHRFLADWCQWLVAEVKGASVLMARCSRHSEWQLPKAELEGPDATIKITPSASASYIPSNWKFELDSETVFRRFIDDIYAAPETFLRELIQNSLDALRCRLYLDLQKDGLAVPEFPTQTDTSLRARYTVHIELRNVALPNPLSGEMEERQVLTVVDTGIGMDKDIVQRYLLQVGRSFYTTPEFQRNFRFVPTSRFGLGFLSVFAVSDRIAIETFKPTSPRNDGPLRVVLTGPRNYLLLEKGTRTNSGTKVEILLRERMEPQRVTNAVRKWCRKVEFPITVDELGQQAAVIAEKPDDFIVELPDVTDEAAKFAIRSFNVNRAGIEGELYVFAHTNAHGESWSDHNWATYTYPSQHPNASPPHLPNAMTCLHGIQISDYPAMVRSERIDYRDASIHPTLSRETGYRERSHLHTMDPRICSRWEEILVEHLTTSGHARGPRGWAYKQELIKSFPFPAFWARLPGTIPVKLQGKQEFTSLEELAAKPVIATLIKGRNRQFPRGALADSYVVGGIGQYDRVRDEDVSWTASVPALTAHQVSRLSPLHRAALFTGREVESVSWVPEGYLAIQWKWTATSLDENFCVASLPDDRVLAVAVHATTDDVYACVLFNRNSPLVHWLLRVREACDKGLYNLSPERYKLIRNMIERCARYILQEDVAALTNYVSPWGQLSAMPDDMRPPNVPISAATFLLRSAQP